MSRMPAVTSTSADRTANALSRCRASTSARHRPGAREEHEQQHQPGQRELGELEERLDLGQPQGQRDEEQALDEEGAGHDGAQGPQAGDRGGRGGHPAMVGVRAPRRRRHARFVGVRRDPPVPGAVARLRGAAREHYAGAVALRIRIDLSYDGTGFSGWAAQPGRRTVEGTLSDALTTILRSPTPVRLVVAGRTDAGVHARGQVTHADVDPAQWLRAAGPLGPPASRRPPRPGCAASSPPTSTIRRVSPGAGGLRRPVLGAATALPLPDLRRPGHPRPAAPPRHRPGPWPARRRGAWTAPPAACSACTTSRRSAGAAWAPPPCAPCSTTAGTARPTARSRPRSSPTPSATAWCARSSGRSCPWARGASRSDVPREVLRGGVRDSRVRVMPPHGLSLEEVAYPPDGELAARAEESRVRRVLPG